MDSMPKQIDRSRETKKQKIDKLAAELSEYFSGPTLDFVLCQLRMSKVKNKGQRWAPKDKALALSLLHSSPKTYKLLQRIFKLPSVKTLSRCMQTIDVKPGFNKNILEALKQKVASMAEVSKMCVICIGEMVINESLSYNVQTDSLKGFEDFGPLGKTKYIANHAIVFMVRGLVQKWKQPVSSFLSSGPMTGSTMKELLFECIQKLTGIGLHVKVVIGDQGSNNRSLFELSLGLLCSNPTLWHQTPRYLFSTTHPT